MGMMHSSWDFSYLLKGIYALTFIYVKFVNRKTKEHTGLKLRLDNKDEKMQWGWEGGGVLSEREKCYTLSINFLSPVN